MLAWGAANPTAMLRSLVMALELGVDEPGLALRLRQAIDVDLKALQAELEAVGAPWTPGRGVPVWKK